MTCGTIGGSDGATTTGRKSAKGDLFHEVFDFTATLRGELNQYSLALALASPYGRC